MLAEVHVALQLTEYQHSLLLFPFRFTLQKVYQSTVLELRNLMTCLIVREEAWKKTGDPSPQKPKNPAGGPPIHPLPIRPKNIPIDSSQRQIAESPLYMGKQTCRPEVMLPTLSCPDAFNFSRSPPPVSLQPQHAQGLKLPSPVNLSVS